MKPVLFFALFFALNQNLFGLEQLPSKTQKEAAKIQHILQAYQFETQGELHKAEQNWKALPDSPSKKDHLFFIHFFSNRPNPAKGKIQVIFQANYHLWKNQYYEAKQLLTSQKNLGSEGKLLLIHSRLALGEYPQANSSLKKFKAKNLEEEEKKLLLSLWYLLLTNQDQKAWATWQKLNSDFLYQDWRNLSLNQIQAPSGRLERAILLHAGQQGLINQLFAAYQKEKKEGKAKKLLEAEEGELSGWVVHSPVMPKELRANEEQIFSYLNSGDAVPKDFDRWATHWLKQKEGEKLARLGKLYSKKFPQLQDGKLYQLKANEL